MEETNNIETNELTNAINRLSKFKASNDYIEEYHNHKTVLLSLIDYQRNEVERCIKSGFLNHNQGAFLIDNLNGLMEYARLFANLISDEDLSDIAEVIEQSSLILPKIPF